MDQIIYEIFPQIIFFVFFTVIFSLLELILILILNKIGIKHWEFIIDVIIKDSIHHKRLIQQLAVIFFVFIILLLVLFTPILDLFYSSNLGFIIFAIILALWMILIFLVSIRKNTHLKIEKKIYGAIFLFISIIAYTAILLIANNSYGEYQDYVNNNFLKPVVISVNNAKEDREEIKLFNKFKAQYLNGNCDSVDYTKEGNALILKNLQLIASSPELAFDTIDENFTEDLLKGYACSDNKHTYLLTANGNWYWLSEEYLKFIKD